VNTYINGRYLFHLGPDYSRAWLLDIRFAVGVLLFVFGWVLNRYADAVLLREREKSGLRYCRIDSGVFRYVCCPNYLGEIVIWTGWAVATWSLAGLSFTTEPADVLLRDGDTVDEAGIHLKVLHTPGHTPGGICLYAESDGVAFVGDTLFADSVGRTDFPGGDMNQLIEGIRTKLFTLPDKTVVHPGHGMRTTIGREKRSNPYVHGL